MRGWQVHALGEPAEVLEYGVLPDPVRGPGQVLVAVHAAACNVPDILVCQGRYQEKPALPFTPGLEIAGEVVAVGEGARAAVGDRVLGTPPMGRGGYAELAVLDAASTFPWPDGMTAAQAAGLFITYQTGVCADPPRSAGRGRDAPRARRGRWCRERGRADRPGAGGARDRHGGQPGEVRGRARPRRRRGGAVADVDQAGLTVPARAEDRDAEPVAVR